MRVSGVFRERLGYLGYVVSISRVKRVTLSSLHDHHHQHRDYFPGVSATPLMVVPGPCDTFSCFSCSFSILGGPGVPSRSLLADSLSLAPVLAFLIWFSSSLSSSMLWSNISASSVESVNTSLPSPSRMMRPFLPPNPGPLWRGTSTS